MEGIFIRLVSSDFLRAKILAYLRHTITALGAGLVTHGYVNDDILQQAAGLICTIVGFYLSNLDVDVVDQKIQAAKTYPAEASKEPLPDNTPTQSTRQPSGQTAPQTQTPPEAQLPLFNHRNHPFGDLP